MNNAYDEFTEINMRVRLVLRMILSVDSKDRTFESRLSSRNFEEEISEINEQLNNVITSLSEMIMVKNDN